MDNPTGRFDLIIDQGLAYICHVGKISLKNLNASLEQMASMTEFGSMTMGITDLRQAKGVLSSDDIRSHVSFVARHAPKNRRLKWAIVAQTNLAYGLARMFDILAETENINVQIEVFKDPHEAEVWLGIKEKRHVS